MVQTNKFKNERATPIVQMVDKTDGATVALTGGALAAVEAIEAAIPDGVTYVIRTGNGTANVYTSTVKVGGVKLTTAMTAV